MLKREIVSLLEYRKNELNSHIGDKPKIFSSVGRMEDILDYELPRIDEIKEKLEILNMELNGIKEKKKKALDYLRLHKEEIKCTHPLLFSRHYFFDSGCKCILCDKEIKDTSDKVIINEGYYDEDYFVTKHTFMEIYDICMSFLNDMDDIFEVDFKDKFFEQFKRENIGEFVINDKNYRKIYKILIINGSNIIDLDTVFLTRKGNDKVLEVYEHLRNLDRISVKLLTSHLDNQKKDINIIEFETMNDLMRELKAHDDYDLIIDMSLLFDYKIEDNKIITWYINLELKKMFPNSLIMRVHNNFSEEINGILENVSDKRDLKKLILRRSYE